MVMAPALAEDPDVLLPAMINQDGFTITHTSEPVLLEEDETVQNFIGDYEIPYPLLNLSHPTTQGPFDMPDYYFEHKRQQEAMGAVPEVLSTVTNHYASLTGRRYDAIEAYRLDDAERAIIVMGSAAGTMKEVVDRLRDEGNAVGLLKVRMFRPFPSSQIRKALVNVKSAAVLDRAMSFGSHGPLYTEITEALYGSETVLQNYIFGLGGRDLFPADIQNVFDNLKNPNETRAMQYIGVRE